MELIDLIKNLPPIIDGTDKDATLILLMEEAIQTILIYCNRSDVPEDLNFVIARMVRLQFDKAMGLGDFATDNAAVGSISEAGRTVSFNNKTMEAALKELMENQITTKRLLNRFKKPYKL